MHSSHRSDAEVSVSPAVEQAITEIKLAAQLALMNPRDEDAALAKMLKTCSSPLFADEAIYSVKRGQKKDDRGNWVDNFAEGFSIRFSEEMARVWRHFRSTVTVSFDDDQKRALSISVWDCQENASYSDQVVIRKIVERKKATGRVVEYQRPNGEGDMVFGCVATPDEVAEMQARAVSKSIRNLVLRLIPAHVKEACREACENALATEAKAQGADKATAAVVESFSKLRPPVSWETLASVIGCGLSDRLTPEQVVRARQIFAAIRAGEAKIEDYLPEVQTRREPERATASRAVRPSSTPHAGKASTLAPEPTTVDVDGVWREIDDLSAQLADGDMDVASSIVATTRKALGLAGDDLTAEQVVALRDALKAQVA
jgi:hypothetical protein